MHNDATDRTDGRQLAARGVVLIVVMLLLAGMLAPAHAAIVERDRYEGTYAFDITDVCEFDIQVEGRFEGRYQIREGRPEATATPFHLHDRYRYEETLTGNGITITVRAHEVLNEIRARYFGDAVFEFDRLAAGQVAVYDEAGRLLFRDRGSQVFTYLFDKTTSPRAPGGEFIELVDVRVRGPHEWSDLSDEEFCGLFTAPAATRR